MWVAFPVIPCLFGGLIGKLCAAQAPGLQGDVLRGTKLMCKAPPAAGSKMLADLPALMKWLELLWRMIWVLFPLVAG